MEATQRTFLTVQGVGSPVPATVSGERAGPESSSSNDRNDLPVDHLADEQYATSDTEATRVTGDSTDRKMMLNSSPSLHGEPSALQREKAVTIVGREQKAEFTKTDDIPYQSMQEIISKMRLDEETEINKCKDIIKKMRLSVGKQRNVNTTVKNGILELEVTLDLICSFRDKWKHIENTRETQRTKNLEELGISEPGNHKELLRQPRQKDGSSKEKSSTTATQNRAKTRSSNQESIARNTMEHKVEEPKDSGSAENWKVVESKTYYRKKENGDIKDVAVKKLVVGGVSRMVGSPLVGAQLAGPDVLPVGL